MKRIFAVVLLIALAGCGGNKLIPPSPGPKYLPSSTPLNVLRNMQIAYSTRDSTAYDSLFDAAYVGTSIDNTPPGPMLLSLTKADEVQHIGALARQISISSVRLQFPPTLLRSRDVSDPQGWATIQLNSLILEIDDTPATLSIGNSESMEFKFIPTAPAPGSPTDTTWHIVRWIEIAN